MNHCTTKPRLILARTPAALRALLAHCDCDLTRANYGPDTWCPDEVLAHLIFGERTDWMPRIRHILAYTDARPFEPFDRDGGAPLAAAHTTAELLHLFEHERAESLAALDALKLTDADLSRRGLHPALGPVTLGNLLATWAVHDLNHIAQIAKALAYQYKLTVGPWEAYLSILSPPNPR